MIFLTLGSMKNTLKDTAKMDLDGADNLGLLQLKSHQAQTKNQILIQSATVQDVLNTYIQTLKTDIPWTIQSPTLESIQTSSLLKAMRQMLRREYKDLL